MISLHMIIFFLSAIHTLTQIPIIQIPLNMIDQSFILHACLFLPNFYYCLFKPNKNRRTIWKIITSLAPQDGRKAIKQSNSIPCLNGTFSCFSPYQVQGSYAHINQRHEKYIDEAVAAATTLVFYNDRLQRQVRPLKIGYRYTIIISVREKIDLNRTSGGSGSISKRYTYGTAKRSGSL